MKIHVVQKGETLWEIAQKYEVDFEELKQANSQISSPDMIMPGMKIKVPSTTKAVKKEVPKKETQTKHKKEKQKPQAPHKPIPVMEEDEKEKQIKVEPEMPLPQIPEEQHMPQYPMMQMPEMQQEMTNYTMINMPQMPHIPQKPEMSHMEEMSSEKEQPPKKEEEKEKIETKYEMPPELPHHLHTPVQPTIEAEQHEQTEQPLPQQMPVANVPFTHMYPVCCHPIPACCYPVMPWHMGHMHMDWGHPMPAPMPHSHPDFATEDCGCSGDNSMLHGHWHQGYESDQMMADAHFDYSQVPSFNHQGGYQPPYPFEGMNDGMYHHFQQMPFQDTMNHYPTPPPYRNEEEE